LGSRDINASCVQTSDEVFREWKLSIEQLAKRPTTFMKIGGIGMRLKGFDFLDRDLPPTSVEMAEAYKPFVETCIEAFGPS